MATTTTRRIALAARPVGEPRASDFRTEQTELPALRDGDVLLRIVYLSLDPYMRGRMSTARSYAQPMEIGDTMVGGTVAQVVESRARSLAVGDYVLSYSGWQTHAVAPARLLRKLDPRLAPLSTALGVLGMPGFTAYVGLKEIGKPLAGETLVVAAASGPVGATVGQLAKIRHARIVGIAGGAEKCRYLVDELNFDEAIDHRAADFAAQLEDACPRGIDVYFENVGGAVWSAVLPLLNDFARIPVCGLVAQYNATDVPAGPDRMPGLMREILSRHLTLRGFIQSDFAHLQRDFEREMSVWLQAGRIRYREDIVDGLDHAPEAFIGLLRGKNFGKLIVRVADE
ncbi:NADP-dependent oxidoreductase [Solimonas marina]|uniref:NADP-dependent oxidoreductase n=1 Tax=Solimonas marina TaxID=2714601 RepID=A0A969WC34_9GAMM|nr:NADP-dependent oxidoreductase [Solimonas marina]NKF24452.1 NADP-dependent oxidoreductase [Solimonas marina]